MKNRHRLALIVSALLFTSCPTLNSVPEEQWEATRWEMRGYEPAPTRTDR